MFGLKNVCLNYCSLSIAFVVIHRLLAQRGNIRMTLLTSLFQVLIKLAAIHDDDVETGDYNYNNDD